MTTTPTTTNTDTVQAMYAAFGRGDVQFIMDQLADDVIWDEGIRETGLPWLRAGSGKQHVGAFFEALGRGYAISTFEPVVMAAGGDHVVAVINEAGTIVSTGKRVEADLFVHVWRFGPGGRVVWFRYIGDLARQELPAR